MTSCKAGTHVVTWCVNGRDIMVANTWMTNTFICCIIMTCLKVLTLLNNCLLVANTVKFITWFQDTHR